MRRENKNDLVRAHADLCGELQTKREAISDVLRRMYDRLPSIEDLEAHRMAVAAFEDVKRRLNTVSLKIAAYR